MAYRWLGVLLLSVVCSAGCSSGEPGGPRGSGGSGGVGGVGGEAGDVQVECITSELCRSCPFESTVCNDDDDCSVGSICIESGCDDLQGAPIKQCHFAGGGACNSTADCPPERECMEVPGEGNRCVKTTPGCATRFDCAPGFTCENESCVDRRVPCDFDVDCPKNHVCLQVGFSSFCVRVNVDCIVDEDCFGLAPRCANVDGDEADRLECAGVVDPNAAPPTACENAQCSEEPGNPVCEADGAAGTTTCGQYGLCLDDTDCAPTFVCAALWPDGRKECVPEGGSCSSFLDCPIQQVCASPQEGGPPSCQAGVAP